MLHSSGISSCWEILLPLPISECFLPVHELALLLFLTWTLILMSFFQPLIFILLLSLIFFLLQVYFLFLNKSSSYLLLFFDCQLLTQMLSSTWAHRRSFKHNPLKDYAHKLLCILEVSQRTSHLLWSGGLICLLPHISVGTFIHTGVKLFSCKNLNKEWFTKLLFILVFCINWIPKLISKFFQLFLSLLHKIIISLCHYLQFRRWNFFSQLCEIFLINIA